MRWLMLIDSIETNIIIRYEYEMDVSVC